MAKADFYEYIKEIFEELKTQLEVKEESVTIIQEAAPPDSLYEREVCYETCGNFTYMIYMVKGIDWKARFLARNLVDVFAEWLERIDPAEEMQWLDPLEEKKNTRKIAQDIAFELSRHIASTFYSLYKIDFDLIDLLSTQRYEKRKCLGKVRFAAETETAGLKLNTAIKNSTVLFSERNARRIRKLLQAAGDGALVVMTKKDGSAECKGFCPAAAEEYRNFTWWVEITGAFCWQLSYGQYPVLEYRNGVLKTPKDEIVANKQRAKEDLNNEFHREIDCDRIIEAALKQEHGTALVFFEGDSNSAICKRLQNWVKLEKAIQVQVEPADLEQQIRNLSEMDGAIFLKVDSESGSVNLEYAAVIVDGIAKVKGNPAKGARHNSMLTFISDFVDGEGKPSPICAFVFSEDGGMTAYRGQEYQKKASVS